MMDSIIAFVRLGRPIFLGGGFLLFALGAAIARRHGHAIDVGRYVMGQVAVTAYQAMTHYANDYFDYEADRANATPTRWSGGSRVLPSGALPRRAALIGAVAFAALGLAMTAVIGANDHVAGATLLAIFFLAWEYSAPPLRLCGSGFGELDTAVVVTLLVPWLGFELQAGAADAAGARDLVLVSAPLALLQFAMLIAIGFPDAAGDAATGKRTLVVRLGAARAEWLYVGATTAAFAWLLVCAAMAGEVARAARVAVFVAPLAVWRIVRVRGERRTGRYEPLAFGAVALLVATTACELVALVW